MFLANKCCSGIAEMTVGQTSAMHHQNVPPAE